MLRFKLKERIADKEFREKRRISLIEVAENTEIGRITLSRMLNRGANVRSDTLDKLCAYFDCRIEELVEYVAEAATGEQGSGKEHQGGRKPARGGRT